MIGTTVIQLDTILEANCNSKFNTDHGQRLMLREIGSKWNRPTPELCSEIRHLATGPGGWPSRLVLKDIPHVEDERPRARDQQRLAEADLADELRRDAERQDDHADH